MTNPLPTFLIGGAPRSGTTFLAEVLDRHPDITMARPLIPEPKVFMTPADGPAGYLARYADVFGDSTAPVRGAKTSYYLEHEQACVRIKECLPNIKMVFVVREPVGRAYSNYLWSRKNGLETLTFAEAVELEGQRPSPLPPEKAYARPFDYMARGRYATFARRVFDLFGRDSVGFFLYEDLTQGSRTLEAIQTFVGIEPRALTQESEPLINEARDTGPVIDPQLASRLKEHLRDEVEGFAALTGLDLGGWEY